MPYYLGHNFATVRGRAFIFLMCISCDKAFPSVPICFVLVVGLVFWPPWFLFGPIISAPLLFRASDVCVQNQIVVVGFNTNGV